MRKELGAGMSGHTYLFVAVQATDAAIVVQDVVGQSLCNLPKKLCVLCVMCGDVVCGIRLCL